MARYIPGGRVVLADGTYELGNQLNLTRQKVHLMGMGASTHLRPSATGFNRLIEFREIHCRVSHMQLFYSGDSVQDLFYCVYANQTDYSADWSILDNVKTEGLGIRFNGVPGVGVFQYTHEFATNQPGASGMRFSDSCIWTRVHGSVIRHAGGYGIYFVDGNECIVESVLVYECSQESLTNYDGIKYQNGITDSVIVGSFVYGPSEHRYGIYDTSENNRNAILGNQLDNGGDTADLRVDGTNSVSAGNFADGVVK